VNARGGGNYQTMLNNALKEHIRQRKEPLEAIIRRVVKEELKKTGQVLPNNRLKLTAHLA
jgi:hypothetical protein